MYVEDLMAILSMVVEIFQCGSDGPTDQHRHQLSHAVSMSKNGHNSQLVQQF